MNLFFFPTITFRILQFSDKKEWWRRGGRRPIREIDEEYRVHQSRKQNEAHTHTHTDTHRHTQTHIDTHRHTQTHTHTHTQTDTHTQHTQHTPFLWVGGWIE